MKKRLSPNGALPGPALCTGHPRGHDRWYDHPIWQLVFPPVRVGLTSHVSPSQLIADGRGSALSQPGNQAIRSDPTKSPRGSRWAKYIGYNFSFIPFTNITSNDVYLVRIMVIGIAEWKSYRTAYQFVNKIPWCFMRAPNNAYVYSFPYCNNYCPLYLLSLQDLHFTTLHYPQHTGRQPLH